ncbi:hypothetical protein EU546_07415 [Candidatus Thorarchaeota archaeon]|nr:MAG: hypothetical protein EU546_07415 [Candidatus Thorarchaeota archaeon]
MSSQDDDQVSMTVWCTLIPPEELGRFDDNGLRTVNEAYEDWLTSMRKKPFVGADTGILLDRIRILMINVGIACALDRELAEAVQDVVSTHLRRRALMLVKNLKEEKAESKAVKETLSAFFKELRFTRDIFPEEDLLKAAPDKVADPGKRGLLGKVFASKSDVDKEAVSKAAAVQSASILKRLYMRLLSPDPWGSY